MSFLEMAIMKADASVDYIISNYITDPSGCTEEGNIPETKEK